MKTDNREFFERLGDLFYSLAVDRSIKPIEFSELKMIISKDWMSQPQDSDLPIPENVHLMFVEMDTLKATDVPSTEAFYNFASFYGLHPEIFTTELLDRIKETAKSINAFFPTDSPYKNNHMGDLVLLFQKKKNIANY
jgi:hypothetical protein